MKLAIAGDSSGANLAAVVCLLAKERKGPKISLQVLFCPATDAGFDTASYREFASGYSLTPDDMHWFWNQYLPDPQARQQSTAASRSGRNGSARRRCNTCCRMRGCATS